MARGSASPVHDLAGNHTRGHLKKRVLTGGPGRTRTWEQPMMSPNYA